MDPTLAGRRGREPAEAAKRDEEPGQRPQSEDGEITEDDAAAVYGWVVRVVKAVGEVVDGEEPRHVLQPVGEVWIGDEDAADE